MRRIERRPSGASCSRRNSAKESLATIVLAPPWLAIKRRIAESGRRRRLQLHLPGLADQIMPKTVMRLFVDHAKAGASVDAARRQQDALRPQRHGCVAQFARRA